MTATAAPAIAPAGAGTIPAPGAGARQTATAAAIGGAAGSVAEGRRLAGIVLAPDRPGGPPLVEVSGRVLRLEGAPDLVPGSAVVIELDGERTSPADGMRAVIQRAGAPPIKVTLAAATAPAVLPARPQAPLPAVLTAPAEPPLPVAVILSPALADGLALAPSSGARAAFLSGQAVTLTAIGDSSGRVSLDLGTARLALSLTSAELPDATSVTVRLSAGRSTLDRGARARSGSPVTGGTDAAGGRPPSLPRLALDDGLGAALRRMAAAANADTGRVAGSEITDAGTAAGSMVPPAALLGPPGQALVLDVRTGEVDPDEEQAAEMDGGQDARVSFEVLLARLGRVRLDVSVKGAVVALAVRSQQPFDADTRAAIADLFGAACDVGTRGGSLVFARLAQGGEKNLLPRRRV